VSSLSEIAETASDSPVIMAARFCSYIKCDRTVAMHVERLTTTKLSLQRVALIRQGIQPDRRKSTDGYERDTSRAAHAAARSSNDAFKSAILRAASK